jgi:hypothetical protein
LIRAQHCLASLEKPEPEATEQGAVIAAGLVQRPRRLNNADRDLGQLLRQLALGYADPVALGDAKRELGERRWRLARALSVLKRIPKSCGEDISIERQFEVWDPSAAHGQDRVKDFLGSEVGFFEARRAPIDFPEQQVVVFC